MILICLSGILHLCATLDLKLRTNQEFHTYKLDWVYFLSIKVSFLFFFCQQFLSAHRCFFKDTDITVSLRNTAEDIFKESRDVMETNGEWELSNITTVISSLETLETENYSEIKFFVSSNWSLKNIDVYWEDESQTSVFSLDNSQTQTHPVRGEPPDPQLLPHHRGPLQLPAAPAECGQILLQDDPDLGLHCLPAHHEWPAAHHWRDHTSH